MTFTIVERAKKRVRLQKRDIRGIPNYSVTVPKSFVDKLGWSPGDELEPLLIEIELEGRRVIGILYYKP